MTYGLTTLVQELRGRGDDLSIAAADKLERQADLLDHERQTNEVVLTSGQWKLVPIEMNEPQMYAMREAYKSVRRGGAGGQTTDQSFKREFAPEIAAYGAALDTAPEPPKDR